MTPRGDQELHRPMAWAIAILVVLAIGIVAAAPRRMTDEQRGPGRELPPQGCETNDCDRLVPHLDFGIELYVQRTGGLL